eukprot:1915173-Pyramimonas_sp.AAC.1
MGGRRGPEFRPNRPLEVGKQTIDVFRGSNLTIRKKPNKAQARHYSMENPTPLAKRGSARTPANTL